MTEEEREIVLKEIRRMRRGLYDRRTKAIELYEKSEDLTVRVGMRFVIEHLETGLLWIEDTERKLKRKEEI